MNTSSEMASNYAANTTSRTILLVNPNTNMATTEMMRAYAQEIVGDWAVVVGLTAQRGPRMIIDEAGLIASVAEVVRVVSEYLETNQVDGVIVGAIGDPGRSQLVAQLKLPVVGIGEASVLAAAAAGSFAMATSTPLLVDSLSDLVALHAPESRFLGVELTQADPLVLASDPALQFTQLQQAVRRVVACGAQAVIIAGGPLSEAARRLSDLGIVQIIEPIPSACELLRKRIAPGDE